MPGTSGALLCCFTPFSVTQHHPRDECSGCIARPAIVGYSTWTKMGLFLPFCPNDSALELQAKIDVQNRVKEFRQGVLRSHAEPSL